MTSAKILDPICDMVVDLAEARDEGLVVEDAAREYGFCSAGCKTKFAADPAAYVPKIEAWVTAAGAHAPHGGVAGVRAADVNLATERARVEMDPGRADDAALVRAIERAGYGALVLAADRAERAATEERERAMRRLYLGNLRRRLIVAAALAVPTLLLSMADLLYPNVMQAAWRPYVLFALPTPVQLWFALPFYRGALSAARHRRTDMNTLVVVGTTTAYAVSVLATSFGSTFAAAGLEPSRFHYYDTATVIVTLVLAGRYLEARARARTADEVRALATLGAKSARVRRPGGAEEDVPIDSLAVGDVV